MMRQSHRRMLLLFIVVSMQLLFFMLSVAAQTSEQCQISPRGGTQVNVWLGPSLMHVLADRLEPDTATAVTGRLESADGQQWWRTAAGFWVVAQEVQARGDCDAVAMVEAPPAYCIDVDAQASRPELSGPEERYETSRFIIHYTLSGDDATELELVKALAQALEESLDIQVKEMGWPMPLLDCGEGGDERFDVYVLELIESRGFLGYARPDELVGDNPASAEPEQYAAYGYLAVDNDFSAAPNAYDLLRATVSHELTHNIQYAYDFAEPLLIAYEAVAVWMETQVFPESQDATTYVRHLMRYPDICLAGPSGDVNYDSREYGHWLFIDTLVRTYGPQVLHEVIWRSFGDEEDLLALYLGLEKLGTDAYSLTLETAVRNVLLDYELAPFFSETVFVEAIINGAGLYRPRRDGVQQIGVDYLSIAQPGIYRFSVEQAGLRLYALSIDQTTQTARRIDLGDSGIADLRDMDQAYLLIANESTHERLEDCVYTDWEIDVEILGEDAEALTPEAHIWDASQYRPAAQTSGLQVFEARFKNQTDMLSYDVWLEAGDQLQVRTLAEQNIDTYVIITAADKPSEELAFDDDSGGSLDAFLRYEVGRSGPYTISIAAFEPGIGRFQVAIAINTPVQFNQP